MSWGVADRQDSDDLPTSSACWGAPPHQAWESLAEWSVVPPGDRQCHPAAPPDRATSSDGWTATAATARARERVSWRYRAAVAMNPGRVGPVMHQAAALRPAAGRAVVPAASSRPPEATDGRPRQGSDATAQDAQSQRAVGSALPPAAAPAAWPAVWASGAATPVQQAGLRRRQAEPCRPPALPWRAVHRHRPPAEPRPGAASRTLPRPRETDHTPLRIARSMAPPHRSSG